MEEDPSAVGAALYRSTNQLTWTSQLKPGSNA